MFYNACEQIQNLGTKPSKKRRTDLISVRPSFYIGKHNEPNFYYANITYLRAAKPGVNWSVQISWGFLSIAQLFVGANIDVGQVLNDV